MFTAIGFVVSLAMAAIMTMIRGPLVPWMAKCHWTVL